MADERLLQAAQEAEHHLHGEARPRGEALSGVSFPKEEGEGADELGVLGRSVDLSESVICACLCLGLACVSLVFF